jgi:hypothetical protein
MILRAKHLAALIAVGAALSAAVPAAHAYDPEAGAPAVHVDPISPYLGHLPTASCPLPVGGLSEAAQATHDNPWTVYTAVRTMFESGCGQGSTAA